MTPAHDAARSTPEDDLSRTLARQADRFAERGGTDIELDRVVARAGEIRRGRRMRASMVMAAVLVAIAVPVGISVLGNDPTQKPVTPAATPTLATSDLGPIGLGDLPTGDAPKSGYAYAGTLYGPNGSQQPLGKGGELSEIARIDGGFLVARWAGESSTVGFVGDDGSRPGTDWPYEGGGFAVSPEGNVGAFVEPDGTVMAVQDGGSLYFEVGKLPRDSYSASAVVGENCSGRSEEAGCTVYVQSQGQNPQVYEVSPHQAPKAVFAGLRNLFDVGPDGQVMGIVSVTDDGSCSEVRSAANEPLWKTCENTLLGFSPDGKNIVAGPPYLDGPGSGDLTVLDARTGDVVLDLAAKQNAFINDPQWEDNEHLLVQVYDKGNWAIERFELNGSREYASEKASDDDQYVSPYRLP